ncbi:hypothetical protein SEA_HANK144_31 [Streptomyces phage Hank144]|uniref:Uncharacterized protein n=1 Tax=Streptomyces phage Hank144 TaxID=2301573 RepID=A0A385DQH2_9CAUD|nr:hypothetical protein KGG76_gp31 [Streptomyces phage Hank144]AXQ61087.1 hypothetical protein SEA_HANK144_31 [Streptomyces phage Hank144]
MIRVSNTCTRRWGLVRLILATGEESRHGGWEAVYRSPDGEIELVVNEPAYDFHIDASPDYRPSQMRLVLDEATRLGLEPLDDDECPPEIQEDGTIRFYLCPRTTFQAQPLKVVA